MTIEYKVDTSSLEDKYMLVGQSLYTTDDEQVPPVPLSNLEVKLCISCNAFVVRFA